jgi:chloramphenicol O-acetyltransferase type B
MLSMSSTIVKRAIAMIVSSAKKLRDLYLVKIRWRNHTFGKNFHAGRGVVLWAKHRIAIGNNFYIGRYSQIECDTEIGDDVILANRVAFVGRYDHHYQQVGVPTRLASQIRDEDYDWKGMTSKVVVEDDVWIGYGTIVLSGVSIGQGSIVAAGSVVTRDVDPFSIYAGVPARKIGNRFENDSDVAEHLRRYRDNFKTRLPHSSATR